MASRLTYHLGVIYTSLTAIRQTDLKRLIAYTPKYLSSSQAFSNDMFVHRNCNWGTGRYFTIFKSWFCIFCTSFFLGCCVIVGIFQ